MNTSQYTYEDGDYSVAISAKGNGYELTVRGAGQAKVTPVTPSTKPVALPPYYADAIRKQSRRPDDYIFFASQVIRAAAKPMLDRFAAVYESESRAAYEQRERDIAERIPGLAELRAAYGAEARYVDRMRAMMESEGNDGARPSSRPAESVEALTARFPVANLYLRAESYRDASNDAKATAGAKAVALLEAGGDPEEARSILDGWLPESAVWR